MGIVELAFTESGPASGRVVVLLHAYPVTSELFAAQRQALGERGFRVVTPDLRGFGASPLGDDEPALEHMADDVAALIENVGSAPVVVGGLSMGGYVAMEMVRRHRPLLAGLLLMDTKASSDTDEAAAKRVATADTLESSGSTATLLPMVEALLGSSTRAHRPDIVTTVEEWIRATDPIAAAWAQRAMARRPDSFADLRSSGLAAAVVVGDQDVISTHEDALEMAQACGSHTVVHVIAQSGHLSAIEAPDAVTAALGDSLRHW